MSEKNTLTVSVGVLGALAFLFAGKVTEGSDWVVFIGIVIASLCLLRFVSEQAAKVMMTQKPGVPVPAIEAVPE
jgi:hypothetical protein